MQTLPDILKGVEWLSNISSAFKDASILTKLETALYRIAVWSKQLENADRTNPALSFVREMQIAGYHSVSLIGLCLYKPAAASARTLLETCLYYSFFRTHPEELATLLRVNKYYITKNEILEYHKLHTLNFNKYQALFGLQERLDAWYSNVSAVIHGQIPGAWNVHSAIADLGFSAETHRLASKTFLEGEELVHQVFLCTAGKQLWSGFAPDAKTLLLKGLPGDKRASLGLDLK